MRKRLTFITLCILLCSLIFTGCSNNNLPFSLSSEEQAYKDSIHEEYDGIARMRIKEALTEKYNEEITITSFDIVANLDYSFGFTSEPYKKVATGKAKIGDDEFDIYLRWDIDNNPANFICCDNREKDEILKDLDEYFTNLYGHKPYAAYYEVFSSLGYEFDKEDGMLQEKYTGNIEDYMNKFSGLIKIAVAYEDLESIFIADSVDEAGEVVSNIPNSLLKSKNIYIINTFDNSFDIKMLKSIISRSKINEFLPLIKEYVQFERGATKKWENTMTEFAEFTYSGNNTDKNILVDTDCDLDIKKWDHLPIQDLLNYKIVSDWFYAPENDSTFYIKEDSLNLQSSKYTVLLCHKSSENSARYLFDVISSNGSGYLMIEPKQANTWFVICAQEEPEFDVMDEIKEFFTNIV